jgi:hypothetical protein
MDKPADPNGVATAKTDDAGVSASSLHDLVALWRGRGQSQRGPFYSEARHHDSCAWDACADELEAMVKGRGR